MIHLISVDTKDQAGIFQRRCEANGIPLFIQGEYTQLDLTNRVVTYGYRIYICLDNQLDDARQLISNPDHVVQHPVNVTEYYSRLKTLDEETAVTCSWQIGKWLKWLASAASFRFNR